MKRCISIDAFRGVAILGMIFFTLTLRLSSNLPDILRHNVWGQVHLGDFILPMFLFASGLSLPFFIKKREKQKTFLKDVLKRFTKLALIGIFLSYFSAYALFGMDEVMLCAILFLITIIIRKLNWKIILFIVFMINCSYLLILELDMLYIFIGRYLGGYLAALYYLPIMLIGFIIGKNLIIEKLWSRKNMTILLFVILNFTIFYFQTPLNKLIASPSFIMLSIIFSFMLFIIIKHIIENLGSLGELEYIGKKPLRYWLMMYCFIIIPLTIFTKYSKQSIPLNINWLFSIVISLSIFFMLWGISKFIDNKIISN